MVAVAPSRSVRSRWAVLRRASAISSVARAAEIPSPIIPKTVATVPIMTSVSVVATSISTNV